MATFYCIHGATFNGDGTSTAEATVAGGVGAFSDAIACLDGTEPVLTVAAKPYTVIFKTNHLGADITIITAGDFTIAYGVGRSNKLTYIFDDGTYWVGEGGVFTFQFNAGELQSTIGSSDTLSNACADIIALTQYNFVIAVNYNSSSSSSKFYAHDGVWKGVYFKYTFVDSTNQKRFGIRAAKYSVFTMIGCKKDVSEDNGSNYIVQVEQYDTAYPSAIYIDGLVFNLIYGRSNSATSKLLNSNIKRAHNITVVGGVNKWAIDCSVTNLYKNNTISLSAGRVTNLVVAGDTNKYNYTTSSQGVTLDWLNSGLYPTYLAKLPDNITSWSIRVNTGSKTEGEHSLVYSHTKMNVLASALRTISVNVLIPSTFTDPQSSDFYANITYIDSTGILRSETTYNPTTSIPLASSSWSATSYASYAYSARVSTLTTTYPVGSGESIVVNYYVTKRPLVVGEFYFIDPDFEVL